MTVIAPTTTPMRKLMIRQQMIKMHWYLVLRVLKETSLILLKMLDLEEKGNRSDFIFRDLGLVF